MKSHLTFFCFSGGWVGCVPGKGRGLPPSSDPRLPPPGPELKNKRFGRKKRRSKTCCCLQPHQLLPLASRQRRPWRVGSLRIGQGGWEKEPSLVLLGRLGDFGGDGGRGTRTHTRLRREGSVHRACFVMLDSCSPPPARWDTASAILCLTTVIGGDRDGKGWSPGL